MDRSRVLRVVTYNVHGCVGRRGRPRPDRIARVLKEIDADVIGLQEVGGRLMNRQLVRIGTLLGYEYVSAITIPPAYGNAVLSRYPLEEMCQWDLTVGGREPRNAMMARVRVAPAHSITVVNTHFGLNPWERRVQFRKLLAATDHLVGPRVLMGDFNEWVRGARTLRRMTQRFGPTPAPRSYPAWRPVVGLDRIWVAPRDALLSVISWSSARARRASDHLPVVCTVDKLRFLVADTVHSD